MTLNLTFSPQTHIDFTPRITVIGVGGGGTMTNDGPSENDLQPTGRTYTKLSTLLRDGPYAMVKVRPPARRTAS